MKWSVSLSNILFVARWARQLVYSIYVKLIWIFGFLHFQEFTQAIVGGICHYQGCVFKTFHNVSTFSSDICKFDPSVFLVFLFMSLFLFFVVENSI